MNRDPGLADHLFRHRELARVNLVLDEELGTHHGIGWNDFVLLDLLEAAGGLMPATHVAARQGLTPARLLLQVLPLEKLGLVRRTIGRDGVRELAIAAGGQRLWREAKATAEATLKQGAGGPIDLRDAAGSAACTDPPGPRPDRERTE